ncbi:aldehyde dehydrogenase [Ceraceosorus bombacis]|uniref:Aldehyde dehydrogenase n=1 Tax=Ceraceosorus bombacis TaxID=401625 RepID=A0A0P1BPY1_9BASI|nr:aldehyde dehydrogenase [Ceraceosorus bombacis]
MTSAASTQTPQQVAQLEYTPIDTIAGINAELRKNFLTGKTRSLEYRKAQLKQLYFLLNDNAEEIAKAINKDLGRASFETNMAEILGTSNEIVEAVHNVGKWSKTEKPWSGVAWAFHSPSIRKEPKGTVLVLGAWNYPVSVQIGPVIGALAAGCTVVLKPSEVAPHSAKLFAELWPKYLDPESSRIVNGAIPETTALLDSRWEHIFYTGNGTVGRIVAEKAAKWLCPTTLELGGKSPVWIDDSADLKIAAHRVLWGKAVNAGQTCIAPDYILCTKATQDKLAVQFQKAAEEFWPKSKGGVIKSDDYGRVINVGHWKRLNQMVGGTKGRIVLGGEGDESSKFFAPTIVADCKSDDPLMSGEIFGPVLPILPVANLDEAIRFINSRDQPLALYTFGGAKSTKKLFEETRSGAAVQGDTLLHFAVGTLPFGGTGPSGYGMYHGKGNFDTFTHTRASLDAPSSGVLGKVVEAIMAMRYPPYTSANLTKFKLATQLSAGFGRPKNPHASVTQKSSSLGSKLGLIVLVLAIVFGARQRGLIGSH